MINKLYVVKVNYYTEQIHEKLDHGKKTEIFFLD